jgi:hypothetical protein
MFTNSSKPSSDFEEGVVTEVDIVRYMCKVRTLSGQKLTGVQWLQLNGGSTRGGDRNSPMLGDHVVIHFGLGYPCILGTKPKLQAVENAFPLSLDTGELLVDTGNFSDGGKDILGDQSAPSDMLVGDRIIASTGGGILAMLRGGSILLRSSRLSEIYLSKWNDLVRIVSRNYEHFTDLSSETIRNIKGRVFKYVGYAASSKDAKIELYSFHQYIGDVAAAEAVKTDYSKSMPAASNVIYKEQVTSTGGSELYKHEIHLDGMQDLVVSAGGVFTRIRSSSGKVEITYNDTNLISIDGNEIRISKGGDPYLLLDSAGIKAVFSGTEVILDSNGFSATKAGHFVKVISSGVEFG